MTGQDLRRQPSVSYRRSGSRSSQSAASCELAPWVITRGAQYLPITLAMVWLWGSVALFEFGPYEYPVSNKPLLYLYVFAAHFALYLGYRTSKKQGEAYRGRMQPRTILNLSIMLSVFTLLIAVLQGQEWSTNVRMALDDPGLAYDSYLSSQGTRLMPYALILLEPFVSPFLVLVPYYWRFIAIPVRLIFFIVLLTNILSIIGAAVRGALVYQVLTVGSAFLASYLSGQLRLRRISKIPVAILLVAGSSLLLTYFSFIFTEREAAGSATYNAAIGAYPNPDHPIVQITPAAQQPLVMGGITYLTHGYYGLSLALEKSFQGIGFGLTNSAFLHRNFERVTGSSVLSRFSYADRLWQENGYAVGNFWMTIYPWIASDTTFVGSLVILFIVGRAFAQSWLDAIQSRNPAAMVVFAYLAHIVYAFPMNNPLQDGSALTRLYFWLFVWSFTRQPDHVLGTKTARSIR